MIAMMIAGNHRSDVFMVSATAIQTVESKGYDGFPLAEVLATET
jgi:hypothetical protein